MTDQDLIAWFNDEASPFFASYAPEKLPLLSGDAERLTHIAALPQQTVVCFLGNSGVGKSTLINALVADGRPLLPAGGIGPLTALATTIRYAETACFKVKYHKPQYLRRVVFPLLADAKRRRGEEVVLPEADGNSEVDQVDLEFGTGLTDVVAPEISERLAAFEKMAKQLVTGNQFSDAPREYLVDALSTALGDKVQFGTELTTEHAEIIARLQSALRASKANEDYVCTAVDHRHFTHELKRHASGHLAPLIYQIEVEWPSNTLKNGLTLVDLPGVGVASDVYREVTQSYVREKAHAVVIVVDRAGVTEAVLDLMRQSGFWDRVVGAADDPSADPCELLIAVSKVDEVAHAEYDPYRNLPKEERPRRQDIFQRIIHDMLSKIRGQTAEQLTQIGVSESAALNKAREEARNQVLERLSIHPVSAREFAIKLLDDPEEPAQFVTTAEDSRIPQLQTHLRELAATHAAKRYQLASDVRARLLRGIDLELGIIQSQWEGDARVAEESERIRKALDEALLPLNAQFENRRGEYRGFLQQTVPILITQLVTEAREAAEADINAYLLQMQDYHWTTLRATVTRGGAFNGARYINLPADIADRFQEPIAGVWGQKLLAKVRTQTKHYANGCVTLVQQLCAWARENGAAAKPEIIDLQEQRIRDQASQLHQVGKEASDELREVVKTELQRAIKDPIRRRCEKFVEAGDHIGPGVKRRILNLFADLARETTRAAEGPARRILEKRFAEVRTQVEKNLESWQHPLDSTADAIVATTATRQRRSDAQKRAKVLAEVIALRSTLADNSAEEIRAT